MPTIVLGATIKTARIPELVVHPDPLALGDKIAVWIAADNKTRHSTLQDLRTLILTGGGGTLDPVYYGGKMLYIVPLADDGSDTVSISSIAGKSFNLVRGGMPLIRQEDPARPDAQYEILSGGGFKLLNGEILLEGERYELELYELIGGGPPAGGSTPALFTGAVLVTTNYTMTNTHFNKLLQLRNQGLGSGIVYTLADISDVPENTVVVFESTINNEFQNKISTTGGQYIYFNNTSQNELYLGIGESLWLYRGSDGWYVINSNGNFFNLCQPVATYKVGLNQVAGKGQLISRTLYPKLWKEVQSLGASLVSDATWLTASANLPSGKTIPLPYRGCFSTGDGSTTFRLPDLRNMALRGLLDDSGSDPERYLNKAGGFQDHQVGAHTHNLKQGDSFTGPAAGVMGKGGNTPHDYATDSFGGNETRMMNIGIQWVFNY